MSPDVHTLTGAYALDALDEHERADFEQHLAACPDCKREVEELRRTANRLGAAVAEQPADHVRRRVLAEISRTRQDPPGGLSPIRSAAQQRPARRWLVILTSAAAAIALVLAGAFGVAALHAQHELTTTRQELAAAAADYAPVARVLAQPDAQTVTGVGTAGGDAAVMMSRKLDEGVLLAFNMPAPPTDRTYQAWAIGPNGDRSLGLIAAGSAGSSVPVVMDTLGGAASVGVTVEPSGGSKQPTTEPIMLISLPT